MFDGTTANMARMLWEFVGTRVKIVVKLHFDELNCFGRMMELRLKQQRTTKIAEFYVSDFGATVQMES